MPTRQKVLTRICILTFFLSLSGCMTFNNGELPETKTPPPPTHKPIIEMKVGKVQQKLNGEGASRGIISNKSLGNSIFNVMLGTWKNKGLIEDYDNIGDLSEKPDYTLTLNGFRNEDMSWFGGILCGLTFFIIPTSGTLEFDMNFILIDNHTGEEYKCDLKNSMTTWMNIVFLPVFFLAPIGNHNMWVDTAMYAYNDFYKQGAFNEFNPE